MELSFIKSRLQRALHALDELGIDLWLSIGRETHLLGEPAFLFLIPGNVGPLSCVALYGTGNSVLLTSHLITREMERYGVYKTIIPYKTMEDFEEKLTAVIAEVPSKGRIALNYSEYDPSADGLSYTQYKRLKRLLDRVGFDGDVVSSHLLMKRTRAQKSPEEIAAIEYTVSEAMKAFEEARNFIRPGLSGRDIQHWFQTWADKRQYQYAWIKSGNPYVSIGTRSSYYCIRPNTKVRIQPGDLINVDFGLRINGFASDNQRSYYALRQGETRPPAEVVHAFEALQACERIAVKSMHAGIDTSVIGQIASEVLIKYGYQGVKGLGHELGTYAHEGGIGLGSSGGLRMGLDTTLETGMVFTIEPALILSCGRLCQEEVVAVTEHGGRMLSVAQNEVWSVE